MVITWLNTKGNNMAIIDITFDPGESIGMLTNDEDIKQCGFRADTLCTSRCALFQVSKGNSFNQFKKEIIIRCGSTEIREEIENPEVLEEFLKQK